MEYRFGLIAKDIENSISPLVYKTLGQRMSMEVEYTIFNVPKDEVEKTVEHCRKNLHGFNVTMPYKQTIMAYLDELDSSAKGSGSVNTVLVENEKLIGYNTDGWGTIQALAMEGFDVSNKHVVMLGAGGVAFSIAYNLGINGVGKVDVVNILPEQTEALCKKFGPRFTLRPFHYSVLEECCEGADLFINASVMGQLGYDEFESFNFLTLLKKDAIVYDVNYSNPNAKLVPAAKKAGYAAFTGKTMTACQSVRVMQIWTGKTPSEEDIRFLLNQLG